MVACKGPGKTTLLAWLSWNFLLTRPHPKIIATSVTGDNLQDCLWTEMAKWQKKSELLSEMFTWTASRIFANEHKETWWMSARTWPRSGDPTQQADTLAGPRADYVMAVLDEAGGIPTSVLAAADAILASGVEGHVIMAGNPTDHSSCLGVAAIEQRALWDVTEISSAPSDPKRTPRVSIQWAQEQIDTYGADNPWVLVNVFGRFPPGALNTLISPDEVRDAQKRHYHEGQYGRFPIILGVDVARFGLDASVIFKRQGMVAFTPFLARNLDSLQGAGHVANLSNRDKADSIQIDATGGYGAGWYDQLKGMGYSHALPVMFSAEAHNKSRYFNKRTEMWFDMVTWIKGGGALPPVPEMVAGLSTVTYAFKGDRLILEPKEQVKARLQRSVDYEDALACTFAFPIAAKRNESLLDAVILSTQPNVNRDYDPWRNPKYDPFSGAQT